MPILHGRPWTRSSLHRYTIPSRFNPEIADRYQIAPNRYQSDIRRPAGGRGAAAHGGRKDKRTSRSRSIFHASDTDVGRRARRRRSTAPLRATPTPRRDSSSSPQPPSPPLCLPSASSLDAGGPEFFTFRQRTFPPRSSFRVCFVRRIIAHGDVLLIDDHSAIRSLRKTSRSNVVPVPRPASYRRPNHQTYIRCTIGRVRRPLSLSRVARFLLCASGSLTGRNKPRYYCSHQPEVLSDR